MSTAHSIEILTDDILADAARCMGAPKLATVIRAFASASDANATSILPECFAALSAANSGGATKPAPAKVKPATASVKAAAPVTSKAPRGARKTAAKAASSGESGKGQKRSPDVMASLSDAFEAFVKDDPNNAMEIIAKNLGTKSIKLAPIVKKLVAAGKVHTKGTKRGTRYFPGAEGSYVASGGDGEDGDQAEAAE